MKHEYDRVKNKGLWLHVDGLTSDEVLASAEQKTGDTLEKLASLEKIDMTASNRWHNWLGTATNLFQGGRGRVIVFKSCSVG